MRYLTQLEPDALLGHFLAHPPQDFKAWQTEHDILAFSASFDLLTTADDDLRHTLTRLPLYCWWGRLLRPYTCFIGTTVSEYALLPKQLSAQEFASQVKTAYTEKYSFVIIKDIPQQSPLLNEQANTLSTELADACEKMGFVLVEGQALAWVLIDFAGSEEYLSHLSSGRRKDIRRKLKKRDQLDIEVIPTGHSCFNDTIIIDEYYALYKNVFAQSEIHFDLLSKDFFTALLQDAHSGGQVFIYRHAQRMIGYNICFIVGETLVDKYVGFEYPAARDLNLYFISWFYNLDYACQHGLKRYIAGWTDPQIKEYLGASFTFTRHAVYIRNPVLRAVLRRMSSHFESDRQWRDEKETKEKQKENKHETTDTRLRWLSGKY